MSPGSRESGEPSRKASTIHDVARAIGVSSMTVSRVINGHRYVSEATREKVQAAIKALNFSPNAAASNLRSAVRIGLLYSNPTSSNLGEFLMGAFRQGSESGCQLLLEPSSGSSSPLGAISKLLDLGIGGIILPPPLCDNQAVLDHLARAGVPTLAFATAQPTQGMPAVLIDDFSGARLMTEHLLALGHRDIAFVRGDPQHSPAARREEGFRAAMHRADVPVNEDWVVQGYFTYRSGLEAARSLLQRGSRPTAIFASNDDMAAAAVAVAHGLGLHVPNEISIAGFDDTPLATTIWPQLTTIRQPIADMSSCAVEIMVEYLRRSRTGEPLPVRHHLIDFTLVRRASTDSPMLRT